ncbi:MAG: NAD(P)/FAD-dependent oxidoreductase [Bacteroidia bacterium]
MDLAHEIEPIVIVGAGPAGLACAWRLSQLGFSPLVLEKETFPRDKVCGDALSGKVIALLRKLGGRQLIEELVRQPFVHPVVHLDFISGKGYRVRLSFPPKEGLPQGVVAPRREFDTWLARQMPPTIKLKTSFPVRSIERHQKFWMIHSTSGEMVKAYFVIGADGTTSRVAPYVWSYHRLSRPSVYPSVRGYTAGADASEALELHFKKPYLPGYLWRFPISGGKLNVGIGLPPEILKRRGISLRAHFLSLFPKITQIGGHGIPVCLFDRPLTAPGCALIGDAGALADPFTGEGIGNALLSGIRFAEALAIVPPHQWWEADWEAIYTRPLYREIRRELRLTRTLHAVAKAEWRVEAILGLLSRFPWGASPLLRWYGAHR